MRALLPVPGGGGVEGCEGGVFVDEADVGVVVGAGEAFGEGGAVREEELLVWAPGALVVVAEEVVPAVEGRESLDGAVEGTDGHSGRMIRGLTGRAGVPTATVQGGMSEKTLERAPMTAPWPTVTPGAMKTSAATQAWAPMEMGAGTRGKRGCSWSWVAPQR